MRISHDFIAKKLALVMGF